MQDIMIPWNGGEVEIKATFGAAIKIEPMLGTSFANVTGMLESNSLMMNQWAILLKVALDSASIKSTPNERKELMAEHWGVLSIRLTAWFLRCVEPQIKKMTEAVSTEDLTAD